LSSLTDESNQDITVHKYKYSHSLHNFLYSGERAQSAFYRFYYRPDIIQYFPFLSVLVSFYDMANISITRYTVPIIQSHWRVLIISTKHDWAYDLRQTARGSDSMSVTRLGRETGKTRLREHMEGMKKEEKERTSRFPRTHSQNPLQPHPASLSNNPCTSSTHSLFHWWPRREMIISLTSWIEFSTLSCEISKAEKMRGRVGEEKKL